MRRRGERAEHHLCLLLKSERASVDRSVNNIERCPPGRCGILAGRNSTLGARTHSTDTLAASPSLHLLVESAICHLPTCHNSMRITCETVRHQLPGQAREPEVSLEAQTMPLAKLGSNVGPCAPPVSLEHGRAARLSRLPIQSDSNQEPEVGSSVFTF